jgi:hypothetical protein
MAKAMLYRCENRGTSSIYNIIRVLVLSLVFCFSGNANSATTKSKIQYIESVDLSFEQILHQISLQTGYQIECVGEWPDLPIQVSLRGIPLEDGLKRILKQLGDISYILIFDNEDRKLKIVSLKAGTVPDKVVAEGSASISEDDNINPTPNSGEYGLTERQLATIKAEYQEKIHDQTGETELLPPGEYGPALTQADFDNIKEQYDLALENGGENRYVLPPSVNDKGLTISDLEAIKNSYQERRDAEGPDSQVLPASTYGPALTQGELDAIKNAHNIKQVTSDSIVSPSSSQGPGITLGELENIKRAYKERHGLSNTEN